MLRKNLDVSETVFALASGSLPSAVAIIKVSGPAAFEIGKKIFRPAKESRLEKTAGVFLGTFLDQKRNKIDSGLLLSFVSPHSHTGEDTIELQCHGSIAVVEQIEETLKEFGARPAERGEFSYRAFLNGKMTSTELENLGDVFLARETKDLSRIYGRKDESLVKKIGELRNKLIHLQAILDTSIDFTEEYSSVIHAALEPTRLVIHECSVIIQRYSAFKEPNVPRIVLVGRPNAGKSSLFNALLCRYRAIVHHEPGTTRDVIEEQVVLNGQRWALVDTAGVREGLTEAEREGINLGEGYLAASALWILTVDGTQGLQKEEENILERFGSRPHVVVWNKNDLSGWKEPETSRLRGSVVSLSAKSGEGVAELWALLQEKTVQNQRDALSDLPSSTQVARLKRVVAELSALEGGLVTEEAPEYLAETNRKAIALLEGVIGEVSTEEVLGRVFSEFCIGK